ncbi:MAG: hypothetical protein Q8K58_15370 [Acidimicrobiales bacterium]|nr:hypothetical protein [Acidimicrobiales bacterium]
MQEPVEEAASGGVLGQEPAPGVQGPVAGDAERAAFVGGGDEPEQELGAGVIEWGEAELVDDDQLSAEQLFDDAADAVVGEPAVEGLDELGGGEVADPVAGVDRGVAERRLGSPSSAGLMSDMGPFHHSGVIPDTVLPVFADQVPDAGDSTDPRGERRNPSRRLRAGEHVLGGAGKRPSGADGD